MLRFLLAFILLGSAAMAQSLDQIPPEFSIHNPNKKPEVPNLVSFQQEWLQSNHWINQFELVILVNKANSGSTAQTLSVFKNGEVIFTTHTSTGRERWESPQTPVGSHKPKKGYWSTTPAGYFMVTTIKKDYVSKLWNSHMPNAVFFIGGIAIHATPEVQNLGKRASGGCVRVSPEAAETIYGIVRSTGTATVPVIRYDGRPEMKDNRVRTINNYNAIVVVIDRATE